MIKEKVTFNVTYSLSVNATYWYMRYFDVKVEDACIGTTYGNNGCWYRNSKYEMVYMSLYWCFTYRGEFVGAACLMHFLRDYKLLYIFLGRHEAM